MTTPIKIIQSRLDVIFKIEYAWAYKNNLIKKNKWFYIFYKEHLRAINNFFEKNNNKTGFLNFLDSYNSLINEFEQNNWDHNREKIEISDDYSIRNGSHRFALSVLYKKKFCEVIYTNKKPINYDFAFFLKRKLKEEFCLYALERYLKYSDSSNIIVLFPSLKYDYNKIEDKIRKNFLTIFTREIYLSANGVHNLVLHMYRDQEWLSLEKNQGYSLTLRHAQQRYVKNFPIKLMFIEHFETNELHDFKRKIRQELKQGNFPIHVPDNRREIIDLGSLALRDNACIFLDNSRPKNNKKIHYLLKAFIYWVKKENFDIDDFCVVGSAYISLEGHREVNDLDVLDLKFRECPIKNINIIKKDSKLFDLYDSEELFTPSNNFYYNGVRIISKQTTIKIKKKRNEIKDIQDLNYLKSNLENNFIKKNLNSIKVFCIEATLWIFLRIRTNMPKSIKKILRYTIGIFSKK